MSHRGPGLACVLTICLGAVGCGSGSATTSGTAVPVAQKKSPDSQAPASAPAHWLPPEPWVYNHWLPYDEGRLYTLLDITRDQLSMQLRDDHRTLAQLAARRGRRDPVALARALVAPQRQAVGPARAAELQRRALATLTQGHLAQHLFFHSLHQFAIPSAAPDIFGLPDAEFRVLRRDELSPMAIGRLHGRSPGRVQGAATAVLRERVNAGVRGKAMTARQGRLLLARQLTQLPRWLDQARYNGPPTTYRGNLEVRPQDYASNPAVSADGRYVAYEAYRQKLPLAVKLGEIAVLRTDLRTGSTTLASRIPADGPSGPNPVSFYNPAITADGRRVVYEASAGNQNFAKRYGPITVVARDIRARRTTPASRPVRARAESQSAYNPDVAASGRRVLYQAVRGGRTVIVSRQRGTGRERTVFAGLPAGGGRYSDPYEPSMSQDGMRVAFSVASGSVSDPGSARSTVRVRDLRTGQRIVAGRANGRGGKVADAFSADPALSADGNVVAFTSTDPVLGLPRGEMGLFVRDLRRGRTRHIVTAPGTRVLEPVVSCDGSVVAFTAVRGDRSRVMVWRAATGAVRVAGRADGVGGEVADGRASDASLSADGRILAFASTATNLPGAAEVRGAQAIYVRDLRTHRTRRVSDVDVAYAGRTLPPGSSPPPTASAPTPAASRTPVAADGTDGAAETVFVTDNAFVRRTQRPVVRIRTGEAVRWLWRARQSHSVRIRLPGSTVGSAIRNRGSYQYRFQRAGTYSVVCSLHAPGMQATVVVRDG